MFQIRSSDGGRCTLIPFSPKVSGELNFQSQPPVAMTVKLTNILKHIPDASTDDLKKILDAASKELEFRELKDYIEFFPDLIDDELAYEVMQECKGLNLPDNVRKASSQWLSPVNKPYIFIDTDPIHHAIDIANLPAISISVYIQNIS